MRIVFVRLDHALYQKGSLLTNFFCLILLDVSSKVAYAKHMKGVKINKPLDVTHSMVTAVNKTVLCTWKLLGE